MEHSIAVEGVELVGDDISRISAGLRSACERADIILTTGGLGPTADDLTREAVADFLGVELEYRDELGEQIEAFFKARGREPASINRRQAYVPAGAEAINNSMGTAPGFVCRFEGKLLASMPGVPGEMKRMFEEDVLGRLSSEFGGGLLAVGKLSCCGTGESDIAAMLGDILERDRSPLVNITCGSGKITLTIIGKGDDEEQAAGAVAAMKERIRVVLGDYVCGDDNEGVADLVGSKLREAGKTVAVAESCTGGLICKMLTDAAGASGYFLGGWAAYANGFKQSQLGVDEQLLEQFGAVSEEVAAAMAEGAIQLAGSDFALAVTGIAGPGGGSEQKPAGTVYIALAVREGQNDQSCINVDVVKRLYSGDRSLVRRRSAYEALNMLRLKV
jgi:nicotinamide-nucleotide amidase